MSTVPPSPVAGRRLSSCRSASMSAPDPFGTLLIQDNKRGMASKLTIIKAPPAPITLQDPEERVKRRSHVRTPSGGSTGGRISFAFATFSALSSRKDFGTGPRSAESSRPASPFSARAMPRSNSFPTLPHAHTLLTPVQVYEVAQQCNQPPQSQPPTPGGDVPGIVMPVSFTPLPDAFYLPFLDRPGEVHVLMSTLPTSRLFSFLAQTFSSRTASQNDADPASWSYAQLERWLTKVGRDEADDVEWVQKARTCITAKSEPIWERVKGALGVPPELDALHEGTEVLAPLGPDISASHTPPAGGVEGIHHSFSDAWIEPIVTNSGGSSPTPYSCSPTPYSCSPTSLRRSPSLGRQSMSHMQDISENAPDPNVDPPSSAILHGLRIITSSSEPLAQRYSSPSPTSAGGGCHPRMPYDAVAERGPLHPIFPSSFANLALWPTLSAKCVFCFPITPRSRYHPCHGSLTLPLSCVSVTRRFARRLLPRHRHIHCTTQHRAMGGSHAAGLMAGSYKSRSMPCPLRAAATGHVSPFESWRASPQSISATSKRHTRLTSSVSVMPFSPQG